MPESFKFYPWGHDTLTATGDKYILTIAETGEQIEVGSITEAVELLEARCDDEDDSVPQREGEE